MRYTTRKHVEPAPEEAKEAPTLREQLASLVVESHKRKTLPIALERKLVNGQSVFTPISAPPDDNAGVVVFTQEGFFEIPKEKNIPSKFISQNEFVASTMDYELLTKLPFAKNFAARKVIYHWYKNMRRIHYFRTRARLADNLWIARPFFMQHLKSAKEHLQSISSIKGIELREGAIFGRRHTDFVARQSVIQNEAYKEFDRRCKYLSETLLIVQSELQVYLKKSIEDFEFQEMSVKFLGKKDLFIGIERKDVESERQVFERKIEELKVVNDCFYNYLRVAFQHSITDLLLYCYDLVSQVLNSQRKPKFECIMSIKDRVTSEPEVGKVRSYLSNALKTYVSAILSNQNSAKLLAANAQGLIAPVDPNDIHNRFIENINFVLNFKHVTQIKQRLECQLEADVVAAEQFIESLGHLKTIQESVFEWRTALQKKSADVVSLYRDNFSQMNEYSSKILEIPAFNFTSGVVTVETSTIRGELQSAFKIIMGVIREHVLELTGHETKELKDEIFVHYEQLEQRASTLQQFVNQIKSLSEIRDERLIALNKRFDFIQECLALCKRESIRVPPTLASAVEEVREMLKDFPIRAAAATKHFVEYKAMFEDQLQVNSDKLTRKIKKFEQKYVQRYLQEPDRLSNPKLICAELDKRAEALAVMNHRVKSFEEYIKALAKVESPSQRSQRLGNSQNPSITQVSSSERSGTQGANPSYQSYTSSTWTSALDCELEFKTVFTLHCDTLRLWKLVVYWKENTEVWNSTHFKMLNVKKMLHRVDKVSENLQPKAFESLLFVKKSDKILKILNDQVSQLLCMGDVLTDLTHKDLKPRHWEILVRLFKKPQFANTIFTLADLIEIKVMRYSSKIKELVEEAMQEAKQESTLVDIKQTWETLEMTLEHYRNRLDTFVIANFEELEFTIEEHLAVIDNLRQNSFSEFIETELNDWQDKLDLMRKTVETWALCQKTWLELEPVFSVSNMEEALPDESSQFRDLQSGLRKIVWTAHQNSLASFNLLHPERLEVLNALMSGLGSLRMSIKDFLESRRLNFPRFFFLPDSQLLDLLSKVHAGQAYDAYLSAMFPGASRLYVRKAGGRHKLPKLDDVDAAPFNPFSPANKNPDGVFDFEAEITAQIEDDSSAIERLPLARVKRRPTSRDLKIAVEGIEPSLEVCGMIGHMGDTLLFETPVPIIGTVEAWMSEVERQMKETLAKYTNYSISSFSKQSLDEWVLDYPQQVVINTILLILTHEVTELFDLKQQDSNLDISEEVVQETYEDHFTKVFFGSNVQNSIEGSRLNLMRFLQAKTLKGLFLRLQFWVNQIVKSIEADQGHRLTPLHLQSLHSLVHCLLYQRDIVSSLQVKEVTSVSDFDWQRLVRMYWNAEEVTVKVECGAFQMIQGSEFLGSYQRLICTPVTTRYFVFISSALRETSSVLFKTLPSHDFAGDVFEEFASLCGICTKRIALTRGFAIESVMHCLNGAALANVWTIFEHIDLLSNSHLQVLAREIQMVQQQFLIAELADPEEASSSKVHLTRKDISASNITQTENQATQTVSQSFVPTVKSPTSMFVVMASLSPYCNSLKDRALLTTLQNSFRCTEFQRPDFNLTLMGLLVRDGFKQFRELSLSFKNFMHKLIEEFGEQSLPFTTKDLITVVSIARKLKRGEGIAAESPAMARAVGTYFKAKYAMRVPGPTPDAVKLNALEEVLLRVIQESFNFKPELGLDSNDLLKNDITEAFIRLNLSYQPWQHKAALDLNEGLSMFRAGLVLGPRTSGKSTILKLLSHSLGHINFTTVYKYTLSPNTFSPEQFYGETKADQAKAEGVLSKAVNELKANSNQKLRWLVFEAGQLKAWWLDCLMSLLERMPPSFQNASDKHDCVTLHNFLHMELGSGVPVLLEACDASQASPMFFTRVFVVAVQPEHLEWEAMIVPVCKQITEQFLDRGLLGELLAANFNTKAKGLIQALDLKYKGLGLWNSRTLMVSFCKIWLNLLVTCVVPSLPLLAEVTGMILPSKQDLTSYIQSHMAEPMFIELYFACEKAMMLGLTWSFGAVLPVEGRKVFSVLFQGAFETGILRDANIFDYFYDWKTKKYLQYTRLDLGRTVMTAVKCGNSLVVPTSDFMTLKHGCDTVFMPGGSVSRSHLQRITISGPASSGKSTFLAWISHLYQDYAPLSLTLKPSFKVTDLQAVLERSFALKSNKPLLVMVEDLHMDKKFDGGIKEFLAYWSLHGGFYESSSLSFKNFRDADILCSSNMEDDPESRCHSLYLPEPDESLFKQVMVTYVYSREFNTDLIIHRFAKILLRITVKAIHVSTTQAFQHPLLSRGRLTACFKDFLDWTSHLSAAIEPEWTEEKRVGMLWMHAVKHYFTEPIGEDNFETLVRQLAEDKLNVKLPPCEAVYGDYSNPDVKCGAPPILNRTMEEDCRGIQDQLINAVVKARCYACQDSAQLLQWKSLLYHPEIFRGVWAVSRVLSMEKTHVLALAPPGYFEVVQIAAAVKRSKVWEPLTAKHSDLTSFKAELCSAIDTIVARGSSPDEVPACVFYVNASQTVDPSYFDLLFEYISLNDAEFDEFLKANVPYFNERPKSRQVKVSEAVKKSIKLIKRHFHVVIHCEAADDYKRLLDRHPTIAHFTDLQVHGSFQDYKGLEAAAQKCALEINKASPLKAEVVQTSSLLAQVHLRLTDLFQEFKSMPLTLDHEVMDQATPDRYFTLRRFLNFVQTTYSLHSELKASMTSQREKVLYKKSLADKF